MSLIYNIKKHCPDCLFPLLRACYRTAKLPKTLIHRHKMSRIIARADKLRPYYRDELSLLILSDCENNLLGHENVFIERAVKQGWRFHEIYSNANIYEYIDKEKFSGIIIIYDDENSPRFKYVRTLLNLSDWANKYRVLTFDEFMKSAKLQENELIISALRVKNLNEFLMAAYYKNLFSTNNIIYSYNFTGIREDIQYFDVFDPVDDEIIVDAGCYDGGTAKQFLQWGGGKVKKIYSFEFDPINAAKCEENLKDLRDKVTLIKKGTWDKDERLYINALGNSGSSTRSKGTDTVYLTAIDSVVKDDRVTFIKMDVEGAELKSLIGAKNTIIKNKPRLAICVYHKPEDIYEIPEYILSLVPEYRFYLRHYSSVNWGTVLYASCD